MAILLLKYVEMSLTEETLKRIIQNLERCLTLLQKQIAEEKDIKKHHQLVLQENYLLYCLKIAKNGER